jgi:hypothetical protein
MKDAQEITQLWSTLLNIPGRMATRMIDVTTVLMVKRVSIDRSTTISGKAARE